MDILDRLVDSVLIPLFQFFGQGLDLLLISSLAYLGIPLPIQVLTASILTACLSVGLRRLLGTRKKEEQFQRAFSDKLQERKLFQEVTDRRMREILSKGSSLDLDASFNVYLAGHFARYGLAYLLPLFLALSWINSVFTEESLTHQGGHPYLFLLPENGYEITGISVTAVFLGGYLAGLGFLFFVRRIFTGNASSTLGH